MKKKRSTPSRGVSKPTPSQFSFSFGYIHFFFVVGFFGILFCFVFLFLFFFILNDDIIIIIIILAWYGIDSGPSVPSSFRLPVRCHHRCYFHTNRRYWIVLFALLAHNGVVD